MPVFEFDSKGRVGEDLLNRPHHLYGVTSHSLDAPLSHYTVSSGCDGCVTLRGT
jgi:hypothetical protein